LIAKSIEALRTWQAAESREQLATILDHWVDAEGLSAADKETILDYIWPRDEDGE